MTAADVALSRKGAIVSGPFGSNIGKRFFVESGVPVIRGNNLTLGQIPFVDEGFVFITEEKAYELRACEALPGDIVFTAAGTLGQVGRIPEGAQFPKYIISNKQLRLRPDPALADSSYLYYWFSSPISRARIVSQNTGSSVPLITLSTLRGLPVPLPPLPVQRRIGACLRAYDDLIEVGLQRISLLEDMARLLYRAWFVELRFPGHSTGADIQTGPLPDGWKFVKLASIAKTNRVQISTKAPPERLLYIDISSVGPGVVREVASLAFSEAPSRARRVVQHGDILWSCVRPNRRSHVLVLDPEPDTVASTGFAVLTATKVPFTFLYQATTTDAFVAYLTNHATGAAYPAVTAKTFEDAEVLLPPGGLLGQFAQATMPMAELIANLQRQSANLRATRDLLLPRLMSGQLRLSDVEADLLAAQAGAKG